MEDSRSKYEEETGGIEHIDTDVRVTANGNLGIFSRADTKDVSEENLLIKVEEYNNIFDSFASAQKLESYQKELIYYHHRYKGKAQLLEMASRAMGETPFTVTPYFVINLHKAFEQKPPILIARFDDPLGLSSNARRDITIWAYEPATETFSEARTVQTNGSTASLYKGYAAMVRGEKSSFDIFQEIASAAYRL